MLTGKNILIILITGLLFLAWGVSLYLQERNYDENAAHTHGVIESVADLPIRTGGLTRFGDGPHTNHICDYTLDVQTTQNATIAGKLKLIQGEPCLVKGEVVSITYDPKNVRNIALSTDGPSTALGRFLIAIGIMVIGSAYFLWNLKR